jgi:hypothetical protein
MIILIKDGPSGLWSDREVAEINIYGIPFTVWEVVVNMVRILCTVI